MALKIFKFQLISDLHLEINEDYNYYVPALADNLILAGDIGRSNDERLKTFLYKTAKQFKAVFFVAGNHEYYHSSIELGKDKLNNICESAPSKNIFFLDQKSILYKNLRLIGTTLWSEIPTSSFDIISKRLNDYHMITYKNKLITPKQTTAFYNKNKAWLCNQLHNAKLNNEPVFVITHHSPLVKQTFNPVYYGSNLQPAFCSDLEYIIKENEHIKTWAFAHTHWSTSFKVNRTQLISNARGYSKLEEKMFDPKKVFTIEY